MLITIGHIATAKCTFAIRNVMTPYPKIENLLVDAVRRLGVNKSGKIFYFEDFFSVGYGG
jgi:hypothetical protein